MSPLTGKRIVDLSRYAPGPYCSLVCASLGADVIKVEAPPGGDPLRALDRVAFDRLNRGKRSIVVDLKSEDGASSFRRLLRTADVLIESFRPGVMSRLGLDYDALERDVPGIVYLSISGYGQSGPFARRPGHDVNYVASAGGLDGMSRPLPLQVADFAGGGLFGVIAILAALAEGEGRFIDLSLHEGVLSLSVLADSDAGDRLSGRYADYTLYETRDGRTLAVGALEPRFWEAFCGAIDRPDFIDRRDDPGLRDEVAAIIEARTSDEWNELFGKMETCVEAVRTPVEAADHPQTRHRDFERAAFRLPFGLPGPTLGASPALGEHTEEILASLG